MSNKSGYPCEVCGARTFVTDTRRSVIWVGVTIMRRRQCEACGHKFKTYELTSGIVSMFNDIYKIVNRLKGVVRAITALNKKVDEEGDNDLIVEW